MNTFKKAILGLAILPLSMVSASAVAGGHGGKHDGHKHHGGKCVMKAHKKAFHELDLTDAQEDALDALDEAKKQARETRKEEHKANKDERKATQQADYEEMQALILADDFDEAAVRALAEKMVESKDEVERHVNMIESKHERMNVLTSEQKAQFKAEVAENMAECE